MLERLAPSQAPALFRHYVQQLLDQSGDRITEAAIIASGSARLMSHALMKAALM